MKTAQQASVKVGDSVEVFDFKRMAWRSGTVSKVEKMDDGDVVWIDGFGGFFAMWRLA